MFWDLFKKKKEVKVEPAPQVEPIAVEFAKEETPAPAPVKKTKKKVKKDEAVE